MPNINLRIHQFLKANRRKIILVLLIWGVVLAINYFLKFRKTPIFPIVTYIPNEPIMESAVKVPKKLYDPIDQLIGEYVEACNNKDYEKAYALLSDECKSASFSNIEVFKTYVNSIFTTKKIYNIQNYTNEKNIYVYRVRILDDILATGTTGKEKLDYYEEKFVITNSNNTLKLAVKDYIGFEAIDQVYEDNYIKVAVTGRQINYEEEIYKVRITNRTENIILLSDRKCRIRNCTKPKQYRTSKLPNNNHRANLLRSKRIQRIRVHLCEVLR